MKYESLLNSINKITLSKDEEKSEYIPQFIELYGNPESEEITAEDPYYLSKMRETVEQMKLIRKQYSSNKDFYIAVSKMFAKTYIPLMIKEYRITNEQLVSKLLNIANGNGIMIFDRGEAQVYDERFGERINGDVGAFKYHDMICFTPDVESEQPEVSTEESVMNAIRMLSSMIHETMHLVIDVTKEEHFNYGEESRLTSGGTILNEGLVEMHALDFAKKYGLIHLPALYYLNNVSMCRTLKELYGKEEFERLAFTGTYEEMIPSELLEQYKTAERIRYFSRKGIMVDQSQIDLSEESKKSL
jgi:hypothetical protein